MDSHFCCVFFHSLSFSLSCSISFSICWCCQSSLCILLLFVEMYNFFLSLFVFWPVACRCCSTRAFVHFFFSFQCSVTPFSQEFSVSSSVLLDKLLLCRQFFCCSHGWELLFATLTYPSFSLSLKTNIIKFYFMIFDYPSRVRIAVGSKDKWKREWENGVHTERYTLAKLCTVNE